MGLLYVTHEDCEKGLLALSILKRLGANVCVLAGAAPEVPAGSSHTVIACFESPGRFPSKHVRNLRPTDTEQRGFVRPHWARNVSFKQCVAFRAYAAQNPHPVGFEEAVINLHHHFSGTRPARKPSRRRASGHGSRPRYFLGGVPLGQSLER